MEDMPFPGGLAAIVEELESSEHSLAAHFGLPTRVAAYKPLMRGDIVVSVLDPSLRYRVLSYDPADDWIHLRRIRKDGQYDQREYGGFTGHSNGRYLRE